MNALMKIIFTAGFVIISCIAPALAGENEVCSKDAELCPSGTIIIVKSTDQIAKLCNFDKSIVVGKGVICVRK